MRYAHITNAQSDTNMSYWSIQTYSSIYQLYMLAVFVLIMSANVHAHFSKISIFFFKNEHSKQMEIKYHFICSQQNF